MPFSLTWLPKVLKDAGLKISLVEGWENRGSKGRDVGTIFGVICHHTVGPKTGNMPSLNTLVNGRSDLPGPLAQLGLGRDGTYYIIAAGRCNHAGKGIWKGITNGNSNFIGIEAENTGLKDDSPWPKVQMDAYHQGVAAILKHIGREVEFCAGHKEYALPTGRKTDPNFDMSVFRSSVAAIINGNVQPLTPISAVESNVTSGASARPTLRRGAEGKLVEQIQTKVGVATVDGKFGPKTEAKVREFQRRFKELIPDGIVGPNTWKELDKVKV